ncbi:flagellar hook-basal body complex protein FlhO [Robertmurraya siralis]|uniref:Flagellar hook-basal body complex protein FlhO n=1 Tax=Robertmurraya siralis TaxID=77777 RepID=A0A920BUI1_9BACI|nr:flagellar hook-basal body protein [Robertmurraya siralis]PAE19601.1 flagellar biosynthesis protein FlgC [Bacillus sp. 7504-2]GIN63019.1 flagellar hook-basal body complex protein FlhO [Robertmurraya siralis]
MFRGFYTVASGMLTQQRRTEMLTNNMANANTPGFKADQSSLRAFPEMLLQRFDKERIPTERGLNLPGSNVVGSINTGVYMQEVMPKFIQGDLRETGQKTDLALLDIVMPQNEETGYAGSIFFTVQNAAGETRYTRNGDFTLDGQGYLTTASGNYVLDTTGNRIQLSSEDFTVDANGLVQGAAGETALLGIGYSADPFQMVKEGDGLLRNEAGAALVDVRGVAGTEFSIQQGFLEASNVDVSRTMTDMLTAYRAFEANQKVLQAYDKSMDKAANEVGRIG